MSAILIVVSVLLVFLVLMMFKTQKKLEAEIKSLKKELENKEETEMYLRHTSTVSEEEEAEHEHFTLHEEVMHLLNLGTDKTEISEKLNVPQNKIDLIIKFDKIKKEKQYS